MHALGLVFTTMPMRSAGTYPTLPPLAVLTLFHGTTCMRKIARWISCTIRMQSLHINLLSLAYRDCPSTKLLHHIAALKVGDQYWHRTRNVSSIDSGTISYITAMGVQPHFEPEESLINYHQHQPFLIRPSGCLSASPSQSPAFLYPHIL